MSANSTALTGQDLLQLLLGMSEDELALPIHFARPANDYWRNTLAGEVEDVQVEHIAYSDYHSCFKVIDEEKVEEAERALRGAMDEDAELSFDTPLEYDGKPILKALIIR